MECPRCRGKNQEDTKICSNCGLKLKITCPKCRTLNPIGQEVCTACNLRLIIRCPQCKALNMPTSQKCRKCGSDLPTQKASAKTTQSPIDSAKKQKIQKPPSVKSAGLRDYAVLSAELINLKVIRAKINRNDIIAKLLNKFYQSLALQAKNNSVVARKLSEQVVAIEFRNTKSTELSASQAVEAAKAFLNDIHEFNFNLQKKLKITLKVKIGISIVNSKSTDTFANLERSVATANSIIVSTKLYNLITDKSGYKAVGPIPIENHMVTFYKIKDPIDVKVKTQESEKATEQLPVEEVKEVIQEEAKPEVKVIQEIPKATDEFNTDYIYNFIVNSIKKDNITNFIDISAPDGAGKTSLVLCAKQSLAEEPIFWLYGHCQLVNQLVPMALFQDLFKVLFNLPSFNVNIDASKKAITEILGTKFGINDKQFETVLNSIIFPEPDNNETDIFSNKSKVYSVIQTIFKTLCVESKLVIIIEDIDYIDNSSVECLNYLLANGILKEKIRIITTHRPDFDINAYIHMSETNKQNSSSFKLMPLTYEEINDVMLGFLNKQDIIPDKLKQDIIRNSKGLPLYAEQAMLLLFQTGAIYSEGETYKFNPQSSFMLLPDNVEELIRLRLNCISQVSADGIKIVSFASLFGQKFMPALVKILAALDDQRFNELMNGLVAENIFVGFDNYSYLFKHRLIWEVAYKFGFSNEEKINYHLKTLQILKNYTQTNGSILARHAELANLPQEAINYWNQSVKEAISVGGTQTYTISQQRILSLIDLVDIPEKDNIKLNIYEQVGKVNCQTSPQEAIKYFSNAILAREKQDETIKVIELSGFLSRSCELIGNYSGSIECADKALVTINKEQLPLEYALLNYAKLEPLFNLGQLEAIKNLAKNEVIPILKEKISKNKSIAGLSIEELNYIELDSELILSKSLAVQGNIEALGLADSIVLKASELGFTEIEIHARLINSFLNSLQGNIKISSANIEYLNETIPQDNQYQRLFWYFIKFFNSVISGNFDINNPDANSALSLAEKYNDFNMQTVIRALIGKIFKENNSYDKAKQIYHGLINFCSQNKMATGALLCWYLIADLEVTEANIENAESITERALEVARNPNINNYLFIILLQKLMAEINIIKGDFEGARMYTEQALDIAKKLNLYLFQSQLYVTYGKIFQEIATISEKDKEANAKNAYDLFSKSLDVARKIENDYMIGQVEKELSSLSTFCQLSGIKI